MYNYNLPHECHGHGEYAGLYDENYDTSSSGDQKILGFDPLMPCGKWLRERIELQEAADPELKILREDAEKSNDYGKVMEYKRKKAKA